MLRGSIDSENSGDYNNHVGLGYIGKGLGLKTVFVEDTNSVNLQEIKNHKVEAPFIKSGEKSIVLTRKKWILRCYYYICKGHIKTSLILLFGISKKEKKDYTTQANKG